MGIQDERRELAGAPVRLCWREDISEAGRRGAILFYHGLGARIADQSPELHSLAANGFLAVGVDAVGHGERRWPDFTTRMAGPDTDTPFLEMVRESAREVPRLVDALFEEGWAREGGIGLAGISMGGFIAYTAVLEEPRLTAVTPILGSPAWPGAEPGSPHLHPARFPPVALLAQNAGQDANVPAHHARDFTEVLRPHYLDHPERLGYVEFQDSAHFMPEEQWWTLFGNVVKWYRRFLVQA